MTVEAQPYSCLVISYRVVLFCGTVVIQNPLLALVILSIDARAITNTLAIGPRGMLKKYVGHAVIHIMVRLAVH